MLLYADLALYRGWGEDAYAVIVDLAGSTAAQCGEGSEAGRLARRAAVLAAAALRTMRQLAEARAQATLALNGASATDDRVVSVRALLELGYLDRVEGDTVRGLERFIAAADVCETLDNPFLSGLVALARAEILVTLGEDAAAEIRYSEAIEHLGATERLFYWAAALTGYGTLQCRHGLYSEAVGSLEKAETALNASRSGLDQRPLARAFADALVHLGRGAESISRLYRLVELERVARDRQGEVNALLMLARAQIVGGELAAASRAARDAVDVASTIGAWDQLAEARLLAARADAINGESGASDALRALALEFEQSGNDVRAAEAKIYLAEVLVFESPVEATDLIAAAHTLPAVVADSALGDLVGQIEEKRDRAPIRISHDGVFVVDTRAQWPELKKAREALERFMIVRALKDTNGNAAAAGRLIGETRYQMHYLKRIFEQGEGRPSRARETEDDVEQEQSTRTSSRPKRLVRRKGR